MAKREKRSKVPSFFYTTRDIFDSVGEGEPAYAAGQRAHLLSQHAFIGGSKSFHKSLEDRAESEQWTSDDLQRNEFPLLCYSFITSIMWSGVTTATGYVRSLGAEEGYKLVGKISLGRFWSARTNVLALHMLYWESLVGVATRETVTCERVLRVLQTPTVCKMVMLFPEIIDILESKLVVWAEYQGVTSEVMKKKLVQPLHRIGRVLKTDVYSNTLSKGFLDLLAHCIGVRASPSGFTPGQIQCIMRANEMFSRVIREARGVTQFLAEGRANRSSLPSYARLGRLMPDELSPI